MKIKWAVSIFLIFVAVIVVPIGINELYLTNDGYVTVWNGADMLAFYGAILGAMGTIILGIVAWAQNKRLLKLEETKYTLEIQPFIMLVAWETPTERVYNPCEQAVQIAVGNPNVADMVLVLYFSNTTNSFLTAEFMTLEYADEQKEVGWNKGYIGAASRKIILQPNEKGQIAFHGRFEEFRRISSKKLRFTFMLENRFADKFAEEFDAVVSLLESPNRNDRKICNAIIRCDNYIVKEYKEGSSVRWRRKNNGQAENADAEQG